MSVLEREIAKTPFAVVDVETTGLDPRHDRIVEIAIAVVSASEDPRLVLDTLVHPGRPIAATEVHGIVDEDVLRAPRWEDVAEVVVAALANRVAAGHNAALDMRMLGAELERVSFPGNIPFVCTMLFPRVLDPSTPALPLRSACARLGVELGEAHRASHDALAAAQLLQRTLRALPKSVRTFADLRRRSATPYVFLESLSESMLPPPRAMHSDRRLVRRGEGPARARRGPLAEYLAAVLDAAADLSLTDDELADVLDLRQRLGLEADTIRAVHARVFAAMLSRFVEDTRIDRVEAHRMELLRGLLSRLGWAPGDPA